MKNIYIGDVHGSFRVLKLLLGACNYQTNDQLWFVGDLVNRGYESLDVLKFISDLGDKATVVLGNHDVHMVSVYHGARKYGLKDTFDDVLNNQNAEDYINWLESKSFAEYSEEMKILMVHAGVYPAWTKNMCLDLSNQLTKYIRESHDKVNLYKSLFKDKPKYWSHELAIDDKMRSVLNVFTRMRCNYLSNKKHITKLDMAFKSTLDMLDECNQEQGTTKRLFPWFHQVNPDFNDKKIIFGHWSALGAYAYGSVECIDGGYLWGGSMHAKVIENCQVGNAKLITINH